MTTIIIIILSIGWAINFLFAFVLKRTIVFDLIAVTVLLIPYSIVLLVITNAFKDWWNMDEY